ncbi:MAG: ROK family protein [Clostridiales bacterium]|nr:ROK family protein [Clostridiales bacterium]
MRVDLDDMASPKIKPPLHPEFRPAVLWNRAFREIVEGGRSEPLVIGLERADGSVSRHETRVFPSHLSDNVQLEATLRYAERLVKGLLWMRGGCRVIIGGSAEIGRAIRKIYSRRGPRAFDAGLMTTAYGKKFVVEVTSAGSVPPALEKTRPLGRHLDGCRIGFDLGASDRKTCAVIDGETVFSEEIPWDPRNQSDPAYHYHQIMSGLHQAASRLPRVDAIGGSAAGIYIDNKAMVASLFRGVPADLFRKKIRKMFLRIRKEWRVPLDVVNDGEVTALAGSMSLNANRVLGIALGSSQAGGYVNEEGHITGWLNELAFAPVDYDPGAPVDEWSGDAGCGVQYFSQQAVFRLARVAGVELGENLSPVERLEAVQELLARGDRRARQVFETIGVYLGYGLAHYADFYDIGHVLILGRVTSGEAGPILLDKATEVLRAEFPGLAGKLTLHLPEEESRRVGQAMAAASLPVIPEAEKTESSRRGQSK